MQWSYSYRISPPTNPRVHLPSIGILAQRFLEAVIFWNHAESTIKQIVQLLLGQSAVSLGVASEMGNIALQNALKVASRQAELDHLGDHLKHFCEGFDRLREYRNFYVHTAYATTVHDGLSALQALSFDGKGQIRMFNPVVTDGDLVAYVTAVHSLIGYGAAIQKELGADGEGIDNMIRTYGAKLEKPNWPPRVNKVPQYLQARTPVTDPEDGA